MGAVTRVAQRAGHIVQLGIGRRDRAAQAVEFFNVGSRPQLLQITQAPEHREWLYQPTGTLSMFMRQVLEIDGSRQKTVNGWARQRLPLVMPGTRSAPTPSARYALRPWPTKAERPWTRHCSGLVTLRVPSRKFPSDTCAGPMRLRLWHHQMACCHEAGSRLRGQGRVR